eukprot:Tbor_TRINITY_DN5088_c0_g1::TRINITY_DN5088_c0_g1_i1::g.13971::m.13971/K03695/clpB; ATP-dependent Clp protease ATP-binding subunit ClpB
MYRLRQHARKPFSRSCGSYYSTWSSINSPTEALYPRSLFTNVFGFFTGVGIGVGAISCIGASNKDGMKDIHSAEDEETDTGRGRCFAAMIPISGVNSNSNNVPIKGTSNGQGGSSADDGFCSSIDNGTLGRDLSEYLSSLPKDEEAGDSENNLRSGLAKLLNEPCPSWISKENGITPIMVAAAQGKVNDAKLLLEHGASVNSVTMKGKAGNAPYFRNIGVLASNKTYNVLELALFSKYRSKEMTELLFSNYLDITNSEKEYFEDVLKYITRNDNKLGEELHKSMNIGMEKAKSLSQEIAANRRRLFPLEDQLKKRIVGQPHAIQVVSNAIRRKENGWIDSNSPLTMLFMGSSGIGKTEMAKTIAEYFNPSNTPNGSGSERGQSPLVNNCFIRLDMSEYQSKHEVAKLIGSPPGYVGYGEGGQLTNKLEKCPNAVVLLDEVEKAHPDVLTAMLQAFDEGRMTSGDGKTVDCKEATFIMTSNLAQREIAYEAERLRDIAREASEEKQRAASRAVGGSTSTFNINDVSSASKTIKSKNGTTTYQIPVSSLSGRPIRNHKNVSNDTTNEEDEISTSPHETALIGDSFTRNVVHNILKAHFRRDEFIGRINEIVFFLPFTDEEQKQLAASELAKWASRAQKINQIQLSWTDAAINKVREAYDIRYGARSIKYEIDRVLIGALAKAHEEGIVKKGSGVTIDIQSISDTEGKSSNSTEQVVSLLVTDPPIGEKNKGIFNRWFSR